MTADRSGRAALEGLAAEAGLCASCRHARLKTTARSAFLLCGLSEADARFPRYPRLPVLSCSGFELIEGDVRPGPPDC